MHFRFSGCNKIHLLFIIVGTLVVVATSLSVHLLWSDKTCLLKHYDKDSMLVVVKQCFQYEPLHNCELLYYLALSEYFFNKQPSTRYDVSSHSSESVVEHPEYWQSWNASVTTLGTMVALHNVTGIAESLRNMLQLFSDSVRESRSGT